MKRPIAVLSLGGILWLSVALCGCGLILSGESGTSQSTRASMSQAATLVPTITPRPTPTIAPSVVTSDDLFVLPATSGTSFVMEGTEGQINQYLADQVFEQDGMSVKDIRVTLTDDQVIGQALGSYKPLGLNAGVTARGAPVVSEGKVYLQVEDVALDASIPAFTRFLVKAAIEQAIKQFSTPLGIEIPVEAADITGVDLQPGKVIITGRTR